MDSGHCLDVVVGRPSSPRQLPEGPCLLIDAELFDREAWFDQTSTQVHPWPLLFENCVLAHADGQALVWNNFSDQRFDGPWSLSEFISNYPNLRLIDSRDVAGISLESILSRYAHLFKSDSTFHLTIRQGDPCQVLSGAGSWLDRCSRISLRGASFGAQVRSRIEKELEAVSFCQCEDDPTVWSPKLKTISVKRWSTLLEGLKSSFDVKAYRLLRPDLCHYSDAALLEHWLSEPDLPRLQDVMKRLAFQQPRRMDEMSDEETSVQCLLSIFPFEHYRSIRPDLAAFTDRQLLNHFWDLGRSEGADLSESALRSAITSDAQIELQKARGRIEQLEQLLASTVAQIDSFHHLVDEVSTSGDLNE